MNETTRKPRRGELASIIPIDECAFMLKGQERPLVLTPHPDVKPAEESAGGNAAPADDRVAIYEDHQNKIYSVADGKSQYEIAYLKKTGIETRLVMEFNPEGRLYEWFGVTEKALLAILKHRVGVRQAAQQIGVEGEWSHAFNNVERFLEG